MYTHSVHNIDDGSSVIDLDRLHKKQIGDLQKAHKNEIEQLQLQHADEIKKLLVRTHFIVIVVKLLFWFIPLIFI